MVPYLKKPKILPVLKIWPRRPAHGQKYVLCESGMMVYSGSGNESKTRPNKNNCAARFSKEKCTRVRTRIKLLVSHLVPGLTRVPKRLGTVPVLWMRPVIKVLAPSWSVFTTATLPTGSRPICGRHWIKQWRHNKLIILTNRLCPDIYQRMQPICYDMYLFKQQLTLVTQVYHFKKRIFFTCRGNPFILAL